MSRRDLGVLFSGLMGHFLKYNIDGVTLPICINKKSIMFLLKDFFVCLLFIKKLLIGFYTMLYLVVVFSYWGGF